ncbi:MAG: DHH family phosphoesterase, partial [Oscillospiraceae bacterium]
MNNITAKEVARLLMENDDILILSHKSPDGDTLGCAFSLYYALRQLGKNARIECSDAFPKKYDYLYCDYIANEFEPKFIVAVDIADVQLFGDKIQKYAKSVDVCIDHHPSNTFYAAKTLLKSDAAAACEVMYEVLGELGIEINANIANAIYTAIVTDTGGFMYANVNSTTHYITSKLIDEGAEVYALNKRLMQEKEYHKLEIKAK